MEDKAERIMIRNKSQKLLPMFYNKLRDYPPLNIILT